jgi:hypothetical protein
VLAFGLTWLLEEVPLRTKVASADGVGAAFGMLRSAAVQVTQEGLARVAAAKAVLAHLPGLGVSGPEQETLREFYTARVSYLEQLAEERPEPHQADPEAWKVATEVLSAERKVLAGPSAGTGTPRQEITVRLDAAKAALATLDASPIATNPVLTPLRDAYVARIARIEGAPALVVDRGLAPSFWEATSELLAVERRTLAAWSKDNQLDVAIADRMDHDLATEQADLAISAEVP